MPDAEHYARLLADRTRIDAFCRAIASVVKAGDRVLEIGCGVGTYALAAAKAGASRVWAVDRDATAIALAREMGVAGVELIEARAEDVELPERADVVIFEDFGRFGWMPGLRPLFEHVRARLAAPGARYLPPVVELHAAPTDTAVPALDPAGLPFSEAAVALLRKRACNEPASRTLEPAALIGPPALVGRLSIGEPLPRRAAYEGRVRCARDGSAAGLLGWMRMLDGAIDNGPGRGGIWSQQLLPFEEPLPCRAGEDVEMSIEVASGPGPRDLIVRWTLRGPAGERVGCSLNAQPGSLELLRRGSPERVPKPGRRAAALRALLTAMDGRSVAGLGQAVYQTGGFATEREALDFVFEALSSGLIEEHP